MRRTFCWLARRLTAGATVPLLALALSAPNVWAQETSGEDTPTTTTTDQSKDETETDSDTDQEANQTTSSTATSTTQSDRDASTTSRNARRSAADKEREAREAARQRPQQSGERLRQSDTQRERTRDTARDAREGAREGMRDARDTSREARQGARDTARDTREYGRDLRRDSRDEWQDTRRDARDARRDVRQESDWRSDLRDDARDFARDAAGEAAEYGRRTAREALDTARDENWRNRDADREWNEYGRETGREWQEFADDTIRDSREFARDRDDDRDSLDRRDSFRDSRDDFARDRYRDRDDARSLSRDSFRDTRDDYRADRDTRFAGERRRDARDTRISRSQIDNFRATSVSARDLGLSLARTSRGLVVDDVRSGALAATIGLRPNDRIVAVENYRVTSEDQFVRYLFDEDWRHDRVSVIVVRDGREVPIYVRPVQLIERLLIVQEDSDPFATFGIVLDDRYDDELVIRQVRPNSVAYRAGLRPGDVIVRFYGQRLTSPRQFLQVFNRVDARQAPIVVERDRNLREFVVSMPSNPRMSSGQRTTYRRQLDDGRFGRDQGAQIQYGGEVYQDTYGAPSGVITTQPGQPVFPGQFQPAQPVQSPTQLEDRSDRPGILPRLFGR